MRRNCATPTTLIIISIGLGNHAKFRHLTFLGAGPQNYDTSVSETLNISGIQVPLIALLSWVWRLGAIGLYIGFCNTTTKSRPKVNCGRWRMILIGEGDGD
jgi:hypothetical protein